MTCSSAQLMLTVSIRCSFTVKEVYLSSAIKLFTQLTCLFENISSNCCKKKSKLVEPMINDASFRETHIIRPVWKKVIPTQEQTKAVTVWCFFVYIPITVIKPS